MFNGSASRRPLIPNVIRLGGGSTNNIPLRLNSSQGLALLRYADDTLIFVDETLEEAKNVMDLLKWFKVFSSLYINMLKTQIFKVNNVNCAGFILNNWGYLEGAFPVLYQGLPLGAKSNNVSVWDMLLERISKCLALWRHIYLSNCDRVQCTKCRSEQHVISQNNGTF